MVAVCLLQAPACRGACSPQRATRQRRSGSAGARATLAGIEALPAAGSAELTLFSPSKVNLFLRVTARRPDGFHDLASLFHVLDFGDTLRVSRCASPHADTLLCDAAGVPTDASNLVMRAFDLFRRKTGSTQRFWAQLDKRVPAGAGLGGGSGNAATALWAANQLAGCPASEAQLLDWSGEIGSDISVFFSTGAAYCTGRGEVVRNEAPPLPLTTELVLVKPPEGLPTPTVFKALNLASRSSADPEGLLASMRARRVMDPSLCVNDLEPPAFTVLPKLAQMKARMAADAERKYDAVFMSGSGSTLVGVGGGGRAPAWAAAEGNFVQEHVRLTVREPGCWYQPPPERK